MTNISSLAVLSTIFLIIGIIALIARHEIVSTRHSTTQWYMLLIAIGGMIGMKGHYGIGISISVLAAIAYAIRWRKFKKDQQCCRERGSRMPEYKKP